jgi:hypothetical protein
MPSLEHLKARQTPRVPGTHHKPFLTDPANFGSVRTQQELNASQSGQIIKIPPAKRSPQVMDLAEVIGSNAVDTITRSGQIAFHSVGDTGIGVHEALGEVVQAMRMDFHRPNPADQPSFFLHLGDVVYNTQYNAPESKINMYEPQFYEPYGNYPGKILAIPGNHDSNPQEDPKSIDAFEANFCAGPPSATELSAALQMPKRSPMYQPAVFYRLDAPFVQILALFSNGGEIEGVIRGTVTGNDQWNFLVNQLKEMKAARDKASNPRRALIIAVHHPPFSGGGGHTGSSNMLKDLDAAFKKAGMYPDAVLSGHSHVYERFTREVKVGNKTMDVPYVVAGNGGHGITPMKPNSDRKPVRTPLRGKAISGAAADHTLKQYFNGFGHLLVTVTPNVLTVDLIGTRTDSLTPVDSVTVQLAPDFAENKIISETPPFDHPATGEEEPAHTKKALA